MNKKIISLGTCQQIEKKFPLWVRNSDFSIELSEILANPKNIFTSDHVRVIFDYNLLNLYEFFLEDNLKELDNLIQRLFFDSAQILVYENGLKMAGKVTEDVKSVLSVGIGQWEDNLALGLAFSSIKKCLGFDLSSKLFVEASANISKVKRARGLQSYPFEANQADGLNLANRHFIEDLNDKESVLEKFDCLIWQHPKPSDWLDKSMNNFQTYIHGLQERCSSNGWILLNFDIYSWKYISEYRPFLVLLDMAGFNQKIAYGTVWSPDGFNKSIDYFIDQVKNADIITIGNKNNLDMFVQMIDNLVMIQDEYNLSIKDLKRLMMDFNNDFRYSDYRFLPILNQSTNSMKQLLNECRNRKVTFSADLIKVMLEISTLKLIFFNYKKTLGD